MGLLRIGRIKRNKMSTLSEDELDQKRKLLRMALLKMDQKGELHRVADAIGISGEAAELRRMIDDPKTINIADIDIIGIHFGIYI